VTSNARHDPTDPIVKIKGIKGRLKGSGAFIYERAGTGDAVPVPRKTDEQFSMVVRYVERKALRGLVPTLRLGIEG
jgi:hypothetical protein